MKHLYALTLFTTALACAPSLPGAIGPGPAAPAALASCENAEHDRPFVIEWDATDASSFETRAASDVVFVRYTGCRLEVVDTCADDSVRGALGSYRAPEWTSGALERLSVSSSLELAAKLPLGVVSLGARVAQGEAFEMEYYVAGTKKATRPAVYQADLTARPGCRGVTHFVYAYNLGAFALGSKKQLEGEAGASWFGFGGSASAKGARAAEKKGGLLSACRADSATEIRACAAPIRLTLRPISPGEDPDHLAARAPETATALNLAGKLDANNQRQREAGEHLQAAITKQTARDGAGCLRELDLHDRLDPTPGTLSTAPGGQGLLRAQCLMLTGDCVAGRELARAAMPTNNLGPEQADQSVDALIAQWCEGAKAPPRDQLLRALHTLSTGAYMTRHPLATCESAIERALVMAPKVKPRGPDDRMVTGLGQRITFEGTRCVARAGSCPAAKKAFDRAFPLWVEDAKFPNAEAARASLTEAALQPDCKP